MERDLVCFPGQFHFSAMAEKASQDTETLTSCLTSRGENQGGPLASSCDPIHSWLQPLAEAGPCSLSVRPQALSEEQAGVPSDRCLFIPTIPPERHRKPAILREQAVVVKGASR